MISLGQRIKKERKEKGLTQLELVDNNISRSMLSLIENGIASPSMSTLEYIAKKLEKPIAYFLADSYDIAEKCESLIVVLEQLVELEEHEKVISMIHEFNREYLCDDFSKLHTRLSGTLCALLGISYYNLNDPCSENLLLMAIESLSGTESITYLCKSYNYLSLIMFDKKNYQNMEDYLFKANTILSHVTFDNVKLKLIISYNLALSYYRQEKYEDAINLITSTLIYNIKYELYFYFAKFNMLLALSYKNNNNISAAIECDFKAISYYSFTKNEFMLNRCYVNLSILYRLLRDSYKSIFYINESIKYFESINNIEYLINARVEKIITMFTFKTDRNLIKDMAAILINDENISDLLRGELLCILGTIELQSKSFDKALIFLLEAESLIDNNIDSEMNIFVYKGLYEIYQYYSDTHNKRKYLAEIEHIFESKPYYKEFFTEQ